MVVLINPPFLQNDHQKACTIEENRSLGVPLDDFLYFLWILGDVENQCFSMSFFGVKKSMKIDPWSQMGRQRRHGGTEGRGFPWFRVPMPAPISKIIEET